MMPFRLIGIVLLSSACALISRRPDPIGDADDAKSDAYMHQRGFHLMTQANAPTDAMPFGKDIHRVYVTGAGPRVILLHELPGLRPADVELATRLGQQFEVYVPLLFGTAGQDDNFLGYAQACRTGLFSCTHRNAQHRVTASLRKLVGDVCATANCGIVGMCLTGSLPLWLITENHVVAIALAQPSLPFFHPIWPLAPWVDISEVDTAMAMKAAQERQASIFLTRYRHDFISSHRTFTLLEQRIRSQVQSAPGVRFKAIEIAGHGHSTLVHDGDQAAESEQTFRELVDALNARLQGAK